MTMPTFIKSISLATGCPFLTLPTATYSIPPLYLVCSSSIALRVLTCLVSRIYMPSLVCSVLSPRIGLGLVLLV